MCLQNCSAIFLGAVGWMNNFNFIANVCLYYVAIAGAVTDATIAVVDAKILLPPISISFFKLNYCQSFLLNNC